MSLRSTTLSAVLGLGLVAGGCDTVDNVDPRQSVTPEQATDTIEGFTALATAGYDALQDQDYYGQQYILVPDALADNLQAAPTSSNRYPSFVNNTTGAHLNRWGGHYQTINTMNFLLANVDQLEIPAAVPNGEVRRTQLKAEAYFFRAINYFDLARTKAYEPGRAVDGFTQGVILRTTPTTAAAEADFRARAPIGEVYTQVLGDLDQAFDAAGTTNFRGGRPRNFVTKGAVRALQARVNLYAGNWAAAAAAAQDAIASGNGALVVDNGTGAALGRAWRDATHPESIFEIQMTASTDGAVTNVNASLQSLTDPRLPSNFFDARPTANLLAAYPANDPRRVLFTDAAQGAAPVTIITKYGGTTAQFVDRIPVLRVSEMLLIRAEAFAELGQTDNALAALNTFRAARGFAAFDAANGDDVSRQGIINEVLRQRRLEFAFEGHRFFDLKRRGLDIPKPQVGNGDGVIPYTNFRILARLPVTEVANNDLLTQNPGY